MYSHCSVNVGHLHHGNVLSSLLHYLCYKLISQTARSSADLQSRQLSLKCHLALGYGEQQEVIFSGDVYEHLRQCNLLSVSASQVLRLSRFIYDLLLVSLHLSGPLSYLFVLCNTYSTFSSSELNPGVFFHSNNPRVGNKTTGRRPHQPWSASE